MEIHIRGHDTIMGLLKDQYRKFDVVLYTNSDYEKPRSIETHAKELIHFAIDDMDAFNEQPHKPYKTKTPPNLEHVQSFLDWTTDKNKLICCCHAGVSRSSATAYIIAAREWGAEAALSILKPKKHWPNRSIVYFGAKALNEPKIWDMFVKWQKDNTGKDPTQNWNPPDDAQSPKKNVNITELTK